ncbi:MAG TPA: divergent polysaccharide deacetylase family protein [Candidatus Omnitrophota bacterium]|nr:divergent polysaccharide deacetylase family protein [Candidatus Omnitrophota bacterium]HPT38915.1 divergent polysaccharide deacetylase family protein [Candidatus Omnitrophota bacterium]
MKNKSFEVVGIIFVLLVFIALILPPVHRKPPVKKPPVKKALVKKAQLTRGRIAIVIDDWGYSLNNLPAAGQIRQPLTCAILPGLKNSNTVMQKLNDLGFEIILHLPMEPKEKYNLEKDTITAKMNAGQIRDIFDRDLGDINLAKGVSNHMGSRITEDQKACALVLAEVKRRKLYFFDSFVTNASLGQILAEKMKIPFAKRDVFLDNQNDFEYIKGQLLKLKNLARRQGTAVGIGHDRKNTLLVLKTMLPQMEKEGYKFVLLSQVLE